MPESVTDRPTKAHEYIFLLSKSERYWYDAEAIAETATNPGGPSWEELKANGEPSRMGLHAAAEVGAPRFATAETRNKRSVWTVASDPFSEQTSRRVRVQVDAPCDGSERITSPDCPLHGDLLAQASSVLCDGHVDDSSNHIEHISACLDLARSIDSFPTDQIHEQDSTRESLDLPDQLHFDAAIDHSRQMSKMGRVPATNPPCTPYAQNCSDIERIATSPAVLHSAAHMPENNSAADSSADGLAQDPSGRMVDCSARICTCEHYITKTEKSSHFATFPPALILPCVLAGCPVGGTILDPFFGAGTTGLVAKENGRRCIGIELNAEYCQIAQRRLRQEVFDFQAVAL